MSSFFPYFPSKELLEIWGTNFQRKLGKAEEAEEMTKDT